MNLDYNFENRMNEKTVEGKSDLWKMIASLQIIEKYSSQSAQWSNDVDPRKVTTADRKAILALGIFRITASDADGEVYFNDSKFYEDEGVCSYDEKLNVISRGGQIQMPMYYGSVSQ